MVYDVWGANNFRSQQQSAAKIQKPATLCGGPIPPPKFSASCLRHLKSQPEKIMASKPELSSGEQRPQLDRFKGNQK